MVASSAELAAGLLRERGVKPSHQRIKVLQHLRDVDTHPTVETIHSALLPQMATLSKTTVYNTLHVLVRAKLVRVVHIEDNEARYDATTGEHGHFKCETCGLVYDFDVDMAALAAADLGGFQVRDRNVYFKGICPKCLENKKQNEEEAIYEEFEGHQNR